MTDLEKRLRDLRSDVDPGPVEAGALAMGAKRYAARTRRRLALGVVAAVVASAVAIGGVIDLTSRERALVPATPTPVQASVVPVELCSRAGIDVPVRPGPLSQDYTAVALCPADPSAPEWRRAASSMVVTGRAVDLVVLERDHPSADPCTHRAPFPEMRIVLQSRTGEVMACPALGCGAMAASPPSRCTRRSPSPGCRPQTS